MLGYFKLSEVRLSKMAGLATPPLSEGAFNTPIFNECSFNTGSVNSVYIALPVATISVSAINISEVYNSNYIDLPVAVITVEGCVPNTFDVTINLPVATITCTGLTPALYKPLSHAILKARYFDDSRKVNHVYVIGKDRDDNFVYGESSNATDIAEWGSVLKILPDSAITTEDDIEDVADNILAKTRFQISRGQILIPPNCGIELYDVISLTDSVCNQSDSNYRVSSYILEYYPRQRQFAHTVNLTTV